VISKSFVLTLEVTASNFKFWRLAPADLFERLLLAIDYPNEEYVPETQISETILVALPSPASKLTKFTAAFPALSTSSNGADGWISDGSSELGYCC
jgi:hypothetical protein